jgi:NAD(P)-dependent dehydrogenase (short-subunit alcohol dehydrogenase family)
LGLALATQLLAPDSTLICISRHSSAALAQQAAPAGSHLEQWELDLADAAGAAEALHAWLTAHSSTDWASATLINNACVIAPMAPLRDGQSADLAYALRVGLEAPLLLANVFLDSTRDWPAARKLLNISSGLGRRAIASSASYCAVKAGMDHFTRCIALEESQVPNGARVCSLAPGVIDTDMQVQLRSADPTRFPDVGNFVGMHAMGQLSSPTVTAAKILAYMARPDFGANPVADIRD